MSDEELDRPLGLSKLPMLIVRRLRNVSLSLTVDREQGGELQERKTIAMREVGDDGYTFSLNCKAGKNLIPI